MVLKVVLKQWRNKVTKTLQSGKVRPPFMDFDQCLCPEFINLSFHNLWDNSRCTCSGTGFYRISKIGTYTHYETEEFYKIVIILQNDWTSHNNKIVNLLTFCFHFFLLLPKVFILISRGIKEGSSYIGRCPSTPG